MHNTCNERANFTEELLLNHCNKASHNNMSHKGHNYKTEHNHHVHKQQQQRCKTQEQKNHHQQQQQQQKDQRRPPNRGGNHQNRSTSKKDGGGSRNRKYKQDVQVNRTRFMSQEFKEQNAMMVDGRLLCRHFLWGRCIKGDECQLEHIKGYNNLIKGVCKFYIQGFCTKGESCPYMHKTFPCKFFHRKGKCSQGADCKFSHEPLDDVTKQLLDEVIKKDELYKVAKAEEESSAQPVKSAEPEITEANETPDILIQPLRANFYNSTESNAQREALSCQTEEPANVTEEANPAHAAASQSHNSPSNDHNHKEPVCYSVEAVLGPKLSKPFSGLFTTPGGQDSSSVPIPQSDNTSGSANQSEVPYSVDAVLRSYKSLDSSTPAAPTAQTVSYTPKSEQLSSAKNKDKDLYLGNTKNEPNKFLQVQSGPISKTCPDHHLGKGNGRLSIDITSSGDCKSEVPKPSGKLLYSLFSRPPSQTSTPKLPAPLKPHRAGLTSDSKVSINPSSGFKEFKGRDALSTEPVATSCKTRDSAHHFASKNLTEVHKDSRNSQSGLKIGADQHYSSETTAECGSKTIHCSDLAIEPSKTQKRPFYSLFASPITDTMRPTADSACIQSSCLTPQLADCRSKAAVKPDKLNSARSFLSLFASPLSEMTGSATGMPSQPDAASHLSESKQRAREELEMPLPCLARPDDKETCHASRSPNVSTNPIKVDDRSSYKKTSTNHIDSLDQTDQPAPDVSSHEGSSVAATSGSLLKSLFQSLGPYQQDVEQQGSVEISVSSDSEKKDEGSTGFISVEQQQGITKKGGRKKKLKAQDSHKQSAEKTAAHTTSCTHSFPIRALPLMSQPHTGQTLKQTSEGRTCVNGNVAVTPLKDLFKTLDPTVFHFRQ
ncbi:uncharacterized protein LOC133994457 [Scomber scombrus]|uniref:uncharacterized protein LOC133994457 n=1 Tax=Scomber scombrus TaxID=13677 RepID=UPI002DD9BBB1|nr:uncharacterized protein LOC133994457 [Scomber scombrus]